MLAYSEAPRVVERSLSAATMDAAAISSKLNATLSQTENFSKKSPGTRQAMFLQVEQAMVQTLYALVEQKLFPREQPILEVKPDMPNYLAAWLDIRHRHQAIYASLPESAQQLILDTYDVRDRQYAAQWGPKGATPQPVENRTESTHRQPVPFRPRPRPAPQETTVLPPAGFSF